MKKLFLQATIVAFSRAGVLCIFAAGWRLTIVLLTQRRVSVLEVFR